MNIWWIRRDLRLKDNPALKAALATGGQVLPLFIIDDVLMRRSAKCRVGFLLDGLRKLDQDLRTYDSRLILRRGPAIEVLTQLSLEYGIQGIFAEEGYSPYASKRDTHIAKNLPLHLVSGLSVHHPSLVVKKDGSPYTVFTPFSRVWKSLPQPQLPQSSPPLQFSKIPEIPTLDLPQSNNLAAFPAGEIEAKKRLNAFMSGPVFQYHLNRDRLDLEGTSSLSPYLRFGMISPRIAAASALAAIQQGGNGERSGPETWLNELIWREFYISVLYHFPHVLTQAFRTNLRNIPWRTAPSDFSAWQQGYCGYPVVDAAMRQMAQSGWMHNRGRMICASFLTKDLLINWQEGERWFFENLVDGDPASNNGGWQWSAGTGTDAAPYFRVFSPVLQGKKFDPEGDYIKRWIPELAKVPPKYIHEPWRMPQYEQTYCDCRIGKEYPAPRVDHASARDRTLGAYKTR